MADGSSIAPTGYEVVSTGAQAQARSDEPRWLQLAYRGIDAYVDIETARAAASTPDGADVVVATGQNKPYGAGMAVRDAVTALTPTQYTLLGVAGLLTFGLFAGWFR